MIQFKSRPDLIFRLVRVLRLNGNVVAEYVRPDGSVGRTLVRFVNIVEEAK